MRPGPSAREKELVIGMEIDGQAYAYRLTLVRDRQEIKDTINGRTISVRFNKKTDTVTVQDDKGMKIDHISTYWMVWEGIYPGTKLFKEKP
jgi:hypothetical protein